jgi:dTDP-4-dehydrorhamnose reductase
MVRILVTGGTGMLGSTLVPLLRKKNHVVTCMGNTISSNINVDLTIQSKTSQSLDLICPEVIINLVALTNVDKCEQYPHKAYLLNVQTVMNICYWINSSQRPCHLIQISSDQLYGNYPGPHSEADISICNYYGLSKIAGEIAAATVSSTILRTNFVGRSQNIKRNSLTDWLFDSLQGSKHVEVFDDVMFSPLAISSLCQYIEYCCRVKPIGVFNLGSHGGMSKADFAYAFASTLGISTMNLRRVSICSQTFLRAKRPSDMRMNSKHFEECTHIKLPSLKNEIEKVAHDYV